MDTTTSTHTLRRTKSELDKFKLFYEIATPTKEVRDRIKAQRPTQSDAK